MGDLTFRVYGGDACTLLAFDYPAESAASLAGFAVWCTPPGGAERPIENRLSFDAPVTAATTIQQRQSMWTPTDRAPLQRFHWTHVPASPAPGAYTYRAAAMLFKDGTETGLVEGPGAEATVELVPADFADFKLGFTRGYVSSQAYATRFHNAPLHPDPQTTDYDTSAYDAQYAYLGFDARRLVFDFLDEAAAGDASVTLDVFAFDLDEPDVLRKLQALGDRLRIFMDDASLHTDPTARELTAKAGLIQSAGAANVKTGHFGRYAHSKVFILRKDGAPVKVLAGSANFSVRGLYVQSNNVFVFTDAGAAAVYQQAFDQAWSSPAAAAFQTNPVSQQWWDLDGPGLPNARVALSPHADSGLSLGPVAQAIQNATSSVLFAIMEIGVATGPVEQQLLQLPGRTQLYAAGTTQTLDGAIKATTPADPSSPFIPFSYLAKNVPPPFSAEISGGPGQVIHHKFVVCDFNGADPVAYAGSSNLAQGGERANGDNLVEFRDPDIATRYAIQAIQLIDHYRFRAAQSEASQAAPLVLRGRSANWTQPFYDLASARYRERLVMVGAGLPAPAEGTPI